MPMRIKSKSDKVHGFVFSSHLRFLWAKEIKGGHWKLQGTPSPRGVTVKLRHRSTNQYQSSPEDLNDNFPPLPLEDEFITQRASLNDTLMIYFRCTPGVPHWQAAVPL
ncbi:hypothetical protein ACTXT7_005936 [Hymenolepis weldensis]